MGNEHLNEKFIKAVRAGNLDRVRRLIKEGADINAPWMEQQRTSSDHWYPSESDFGSVPVTPLIEAATNGKIKMVKLLLKNGADVNAVDDTGATAMQHAAWYGKRNGPLIEELLIKAAKSAKSRKKKVSKKTGKKSICEQCKKTFGGERKKKHCRECNENYCESHFKIGKWGRFHVTSDDDTRSVACPKGHQYLEDESGELYHIG